MRVQLEECSINNKHFCSSTVIVPTPSVCDIRSLIADNVAVDDHSIAINTADDLPPMRVDTAPGDALDASKVTSAAESDATI